jgi:hypothetical protein
VPTCASGVADARTKSIAVGLDHQQPGGERQVRAEPFGESTEHFASTQRIGPV